MGTKDMVTSCQTLMNHTGDADLFKVLEDIMHEAQREEAEVEQLLKEHGVSLPPSPAEKPYSDLESIPVGARFNDSEIAGAISKSVAASLVACSQAMAQCTREDIGMLFGQYHNTNAQISTRLLRLNKDKGWLVMPPIHDHIPQTVTV